VVDSKNHEVPSYAAALSNFLMLLTCIS